MTYPSLVILSEAKDLRMRDRRSFAVFAAQDDGINKNPTPKTDVGPSKANSELPAI
jgi:hypothetical protein